ncbi:MAG: SDR family oxidoreductase [Pseudomonadota bacterium]
MTRTLLCFGFGYTAGVLAARLRDDGWRIKGTTRRGEKLEQLEAGGIEAHLFDRATPLTDAQIFEDVTHVLTSIAPDEVGDPVIDMHGRDLENGPQLEWCGYLGTTAVYGDHQGGWVDETTPVSPTMPRAARRVAAERQWLESSLSAHIFRLAGIYGPGRNPFQNLKSGTARRIVKPGQVFSRIHVEDIANVLEASIRQPNPGRIYNVCDDEPAPPQDVVAYAADLIGFAPPPELDYETAELSPIARSFYADNRRVRNDRIKDELGVALQYPTYRTGLGRLLKEER